MTSARTSTSALATAAERTQYDEMMGTRGIGHEGWKAVTVPDAQAGPK